MFDVADGFRVGEMFRLHQALSQEAVVLSQKYVESDSATGRKQPATGYIHFGRFAAGEKRSQSGNDHAVVIGQ
jgi:hypothetical protein